MLDISIIILNYKSRGLALNCVKSIKEADFGSLKYEIIVVDNNSDDGVGEIISWQYPEIKFIQNKKNLGMGAGNNVGIKKAEGKYAVIVNPDTMAFPGTFLKLYNFMEASPEAGIAGPKQFYQDKTIQDSCYQWYNLFTPVYRRTPLGKFKFARQDISRFLMKDFDHNSVKEVDWLLGSFLFCRRACLDQIGLFDERFFMYFEDTDLCRRAWQKGWKVIYYPQSQIIHNHKRESAEMPWYKFLWNQAARAHVISWLKYLHKWRNAHNVERITHNA